MDPDRWEQVQNIFHAALRRDSDQWGAFLDQACFEDHELRSEVASLLEGHAHGTAVGWFEDVPATRPLERMGQYRIVKLLGEGGMGSVYLAEREGTDFKQKVALKLMRADFQSSAVEDRLRSERRILAGLEHPGIARLIDGGTTPTGQPYYAMEYVEGSNVVDYSDERRLSIAKRLELFLRICEPVLYAHQQLVVHRDIKPNNILVTHDGLPKLLDFGIAKALDPDRDLQRMTRTGAWFTPAYAAPEQIRGDQVSTLSDVYALAASGHPRKSSA
jgi:serine/threonine protein kinase